MTIAGCSGEDGSLLLDQVRDVIALPRFPKNIQTDDSGFFNTNPEEEWNNEVDPDVRDQLEEFVATVASLYRSHGFHNFAHCVHVTRSMVGFFSQAAAPLNQGERSSTGSPLDDAMTILSDPLIQFACLFSSLAHDIGHPGVPNATLIQEKAPIAESYGYKSVAEQNSFDIAWGLFMGPEYASLRGAICSDTRELETVRQVIVNTLLATDISDRAANDARRRRWDQAFRIQSAASSFAVDRMATVLMEHIIQASDIIHTMQDWNTYCRWNECLFDEVYQNYLQGRVDKNPTLDWYQEELGFFDFCVIPLAQLLYGSGAFRTLSNELLQHAIQNRQSG